MENPSSAVDWHSQIAVNFNQNYEYRKRFKERYKVWSSLIDKYSHQEKSALDLGCGSGVFSFLLAEKNKKVIGVDGSDKMIAICTAKKAQSKAQNLSFYTSNIESLEDLLLPKTNLLISSSVLEYVKNLDDALKSMANLVKDKGILIISMPNRSSLYRKIEPVLYKVLKRPSYYKYVKNVITPRNLSNRLNPLGIVMQEHYYFASTLGLSPILRRVGLSKFSDNLFIAVFKKG